MCVGGVTTENRCRRRKGWSGENGNVSVRYVGIEVAVGFSSILFY